MKNNDRNYDLYVLASPQNRMILFLSNLFEVIFGLFALNMILSSENFNANMGFKVLFLFFFFLILDKLLMSYTLEYILVFKNKIEEFQYNFISPRKSIEGEVQPISQNEPEDDSSFFKKRPEKEIKIISFDGEEITYDVFEV